MPMLMDLGLEEEGVLAATTANKRDTGHNLPSFRPPMEKPYVLLAVCFLIDGVQGLRDAISLGFGA